MFSKVRFASNFFSSSKSRYTGLSLGKVVGSFGNYIPSDRQIAWCAVAHLQSLKQVLLSVVLLDVAGIAQ